jgi:homoserine O-acetyltransferase
LEGVAAALNNAATMEAGLKAFGRVYAGWAYSAAFYRDELYQDMGFATLEDFLKFWEDDHLTWHKDDLLAMLWTWQNAKLPLADLAKITARAIIMPADTDAYFTPDEARLEAAAMPNAELRVINSPYGHCAGAPGRYPRETAMIEQAINELLG